MLDIQFIRDNPVLVKEKSAQKGYKVDIDQLLELDGQRKSKLTQIEELRHRRNEQAAELKKGRPTEEQITEGKRLKDEIAGLEGELKIIEDKYGGLLKAVPNMPLDDVPVGQSEDDNIISKTVGVKPEFNFKPKTHWELGEAKDLIDKKHAALVAGSRFVYQKGGLVELQFATIQFVLQTLTNERFIEKLIQENGLSLVAKPFVPVLPPAVIRSDVFDAMDRLEPRDDRYKVGEDDDELWLQGSAEHTLGSMYKDEILAEELLPIRYVGYATSFRREAGTYGKDTEGIMRLHQFDKLEMEVFSTPETGLDEHRLQVAIQEYLVQSLGLPYQFIMKCTADIGKPNARGVDLNTWLAGQGEYRETHTADYMTDYQARRLKTRLRRTSGEIEYLHTNDATAIAFSRIPAAIMENYQTADGHIIIPEVLRPFMNGKTEI